MVDSKIKKINIGEIIKDPEMLEFVRCVSMQLKSYHF